LDTLEVLPWGALVVLVIVVGIEILGDAVVGDRASVFAATVLAVALAELSARKVELPNFEVLPPLLGA
jgi:hypothetical protein